MEQSHISRRDTCSSLERLDLLGSRFHAASTSAFQPVFPSSKISSSAGQYLPPSSSNRSLSQDSSNDTITDASFQIMDSLDTHHRSILHRSTQHRLSLSSETLDVVPSSSCMPGNEVVSSSSTSAKVILKRRTSCKDCTS